MIPDDRTELSLTSILLGMQADMAAGFSNLRTLLEAKASKHDVENLDRTMRSGFEAHEKRLSTLESARMTDEAEMNAVEKSEKGRSESLRWKMTAAAAAVAAFGSGGYFIYSLAAHH